MKAETLIFAVGLILIVLLALRADNLRTELEETRKQRDEMKTELPAETRDRIERIADQSTNQFHPMSEVGNEIKRLIVAALAQLAEEERRERWQPIETAPKDSKFLCALKTDDGYEFGVAELTSRGAVQSTDDCEPYFCRSYYCEATHWQPLPNPPPS